MRKKSKLFFSSLIIMLIYLTFITPKIYAANKNIYGDVNLDGKVNMKDAAAVSAYLKNTSKLSSVQLKLADVNGDGKVTDIDRSLIIGKYMGTIKYFPIEVKYGDIDGDGKISKTDAELVANYVQGKKKLTATQLALADVNATGKVNAKDAQLILQRAQGLIVAFPIESDSNVTLSTESSEKIIKTARDVLRNMINKKITYGAQTWHDIKKTSEEDTLYVCATYVSVVLYNSGLLTENQINSYNYHYTGPGGIPDMLKAAGWTQVKPSEARAGDIINVYGGASRVLIYAGGDYCYDESCAQDNHSIEPRAVWPYYKNDSRTQVWRAPATTTNQSTSITTTKCVQYYQNDYSNVAYGIENIGNCGGGPTSFAMVASTISGKTITPEDAIKWCGNNYYAVSAGTYWSYFGAAAKHFNLNCTVRNTDKISEAVEALKNGKLVISAQGPGLFTEGAQFIVLKAIDSNGKISVNDPDKNNAVGKGYNNRKFSQSEISAAGTQYFIFE